MNLSLPQIPVTSRGCTDHQLLAVNKAFKPYLNITALIMASLSKMLLSYNYP